MNGQCGCGYRPGRISPIDCRCVTHRELNERLRKIDPDEGYYQKEIDELKATKQDKLIAGTNITIEGSMISADLDSTNFYNKTETDELLTGKQNTLTAGENIVISEDNVISTDAHMLVTLTPTGAPVGGVTDYTWISEYTYAELVASLDKVAFKTTEAGSENILVPTELYEALESSQDVIFGMIPSNDATVPKITNIELIVRPDGTAKTAETTALISGATYTAGENITISASNVISATDTTYTAGNNVDITGNVISAGTHFEVGDEVKIGTWTENSVTYDVYRTVVDFGALPNAGDKDVPHGITNVVKFIDLRAIADDGTHIRPIPFTSDTVATNQITLYASRTDVHIHAGTDRSNENAYVIVEYLKNQA